jgi:hypothetical protein
MGLVTGAALFRSSPHEALGVEIGVSAKQARDFYSQAAGREADERAQAERHFPGFPWSQDDDFHKIESKFAKDYAKSHAVPLWSVLDAFDRGMREKWPAPPDATPNPSVIPCRPRLSY